MSERPRESPVMQGVHSEREAFDHLMDALEDANMRQQLEIKQTMHDFLLHARQDDLNFYLLHALSPDNKKPDTAWIVSLLFKRGAFVDTDESFTFLRFIFDENTSADVIGVCDTFWPHLIVHGLNVNGLHSDGNGNVLTGLMENPGGIQLALQHGADPLMKTRDTQLDPVQFIKMILRHFAPGDSIYETGMQSLDHIRAARMKLPLSPNPRSKYDNSPVHGRNSDTERHDRHVPTPEQMDVLLRGAPLETIRDPERKSFMGLLMALYAFESGGLLTNDLMQKRHVEIAIRTSLKYANQTERNFALLKVSSPSEKTRHQALIIDILFKRGAFIESDRSYELLSYIFDDETDPEVLRIFKLHWKFLIDHGLDVNGVYNDGEHSLLSVNAINPNTIRKALEHGADPNLFNDRTQLSVLEHMQHKLMDNKSDYAWQRRIQESMGHVQRAQAEGFEEGRVGEKRTHGLSEPDYLNEDDQPTRSSRAHALGWSSSRR